MFKKITIFVYGMFSYALFLATFLYAAGFVGNLLVSNSLDSAPRLPVGKALIIDTVLLWLFALQHSVMARKGFEKVWTRIIPESAERSTYVLFSSVALILVIYFWQPIGGMIWNAENTVAEGVLRGIFVLGIVVILASTAMINHFDLFGVRQVYLQLVGRVYDPPRFATPLFYRYVRHPLYLGWLLFFWSSPVMTYTHAFFASMTTAYILVGIYFEERDLLADHGEQYRAYREQVPMILPVKGKVLDFEPALTVKSKAA